VIDAQVLRDRIDLADVIERTGTKLDRKGHARYIRGVEHDSFVVDTQAQRWHWYSQNEWGDVFDWLQRQYSCTFAEAVAMVEQGGYAYAPMPAKEARPVQPAPQLSQTLHLSYHRNLTPEAREWWHRQGINDDGISRFFLGYCECHPAYNQPTYTIPVLEGGKLLNIRHRLSNPARPQDKYRPECAGLPAALYNSDVLTPELGGIVIVAGEKKVAVLWQNGIPAISSTAGCAHWLDEWTTRLQYCRKVFVAFDPGESKAAWKVAGMIGERAFVVNLPDKPDDFIVAHGEEEFRRYLREAEPYADRDYWAKRMPGRALWGRILE
jgi:DNA primase